MTEPIANTLYSMSKDYAFSIAHQLEGLPAEHQCARMHGHNIIVRVILHGKLDDVGFIVDYGRLAGFGAYLDEHYDHRNLNEVVLFNPTAELMAAHLLDHVLIPMLFKMPEWRRLDRAEVAWSETPKSWASAFRYL